MTIDEVTIEPPPLTPGRALLLAEGIDLDCLTRALKLDEPGMKRVMKKIVLCFLAIVKV